MAAPSTDEVKVQYLKPGHARGYRSEADRVYGDGTLFDFINLANGSRRRMPAKIRN
jgi:hypothetical protein